MHCRYCLMTMPHVAWELLGVQELDLGGGWGISAESLGPSTGLDPEQVGVQWKTRLLSSLLIPHLAMALH